MKSAIALLLVALVAAPAFGASLEVGGNGPSAPWPPAAGDVDCTSSQGAVTNTALGLTGTGIQGACAPGNPGNLIGFAFKLTACQAGFVKVTRVEFRDHQSNPDPNAPVGEKYFLYLWKDQGGLPNDACGLECGAAVLNPLTINAPGISIQSYNWYDEACPCFTALGETIYVGTVYETLRPGPGQGGYGSWYVGGQNTTGNAGLGFVNQTGNHGAWQDLNGFGFGWKWGVQGVFGPNCGVVPVQGSTWGTVKSLYQ